MKNILKILLVVTQVLLGICESEEIATVEILDAIDPDIAAEVNLTTVSFELFNNENQFTSC